MRFAIIAAGEGSRLQAEGARQSKPLIPLGGEPLLRRMLRQFVACGADDIVLIVNERMPDVAAYARQQARELASQGVRLRVKVQSTPSSMHSLHALSPWLEGDAFCLSTVDTVFRPEALRAYIDAFRNQPQVDALMAVTDFIDDERPLYVQTDDAMRVTAYRDQLDEGERCRYISGGMYCLRPSCLDVLHRCVEAGQSRMRRFQAQLVREGLDVRAFDMGRIFDIDHLSDLAKAEHFLGQ